MKIRRGSTRKTQWRIELANDGAARISSPGGEMFVYKFAVSPGRRFTRRDCYTGKPIPAVRQAHGGLVIWGRGCHQRAVFLKEYELYGVHGWRRNRPFAVLAHVSQVILRLYL